MLPKLTITRHLLGQFMGKTQRKYANATFCGDADTKGWRCDEAGAFKIGRRTLGDRKDQK